MSSRRVKYLVFKFPNGEIFHVPAEIIAEDRTMYYATKIDGFDKDTKEWQDEYTYCLGSISELIDWFSNNMSWEDIDESAVKVKDRDKNCYQEMINSGEMYYNLIECDE